ncbi:hypothetical protein CKAH01_13423 [Colletotrichum kahawae]|uniref:Uncharacterized protein n=1 Tax=Colletotrichum kahawae TaxID=34407 RepID=A0AAD9YNA2_COLKA|nr:hypothetical protein CKAH01_13423 [Colletotrichum kahawae]
MTGLATPTNMAAAAWGHGEARWVEIEDGWTHSDGQIDSGPSPWPGLPHLGQIGNHQERTITTAVFQGVLGTS